MAPDAPYAVTGPAFDLSEAVVCRLRHYPGRNEEEFNALVTTAADRDAVRAVLDEAQRLDLDLSASLVEIGEQVREQMRRRRPELSEAALDKLGNYVTYLVR